MRTRANDAPGVTFSGGWVSVSGSLLTNLPLALSSSAATRLSVPASVVIPAGGTAVSFDLTLIDNSLVDGSEVVTVTAQAGGFAFGAANIRVNDDETPSAAFNPSPPDLSSNIAAET